jgi:hypothetical protein
VPGIAFKAFAGLNYDSAVPGVAAPSFTNAALLQNRNAAGIKFESETSRYAGIGLTITPTP